MQSALSLCFDDFLFSWYMRLVFVLLIPISTIFTFINVVVVVIFLGQGSDSIALQWRVEDQKYYNVVALGKNDTVSVTSQMVWCKCTDLASNPHMISEIDDKIDATSLEVNVRTVLQAFQGGRISSELEMSKNNPNNDTQHAQHLQDSMDNLRVNLESIEEKVDRLQQSMGPTRIQELEEKIEKVEQKLDRILDLLWHDKDNK
jgi:hypothetical protein